MGRTSRTIAQTSVSFTSNLLWRIRSRLHDRTILHRSFWAWYRDIWLVQRVLFNVLLTCLQLLLLLFFRGIRIYWLRWLWNRRIHLDFSWASHRYKWCSSCCRVLLRACIWIILTWRKSREIVRIQEMTSIAFELLRGLHE